MILSLSFFINLVKQQLQKETLLNPYIILVTNLTYCLFSITNKQFAPDFNNIFKALYAFNNNLILLFFLYYV